MQIASWALLALLLPTAAAEPTFHAIVPDLPGPGQGDEGFALVDREGPTDLTGWVVTDGEGTWDLPGIRLGPRPIWFTGDLGAWARHDGPPATAWTASGFALGNDHDDLHLVDPSGRVVDEMRWGPDGDVTRRSPGAVYFQNETGSWVAPRLHRIGESAIPAASFTVDAVTAFLAPDAIASVLGELVAGASRRLILHVYEMESGPLVDALADAARSGVPVDVLVSGNVVGRSANETLRQEAAWQGLQEAGARVVVAGTGRYRYHHLKVLVADHAVAVLSENWVDNGAQAGPRSGNRGWGVVLHGAAVADWFSDRMAEDRRAWDSHPFTPHDTGVPRLRLPRQTSDHAPVGAVRFPGPLRVTPIIAPDHAARPDDPITALLRGAGERILGQQMTWNLQETGGQGWDRSDRWNDAVAQAIGRGVEVHLQLGRSPEGPLPVWWNDTVRPFDHPDLGRLHNKGWVIDDAVVVGSLNAAHASRANNREVSVIIHDGRVADWFAARFHEDEAAIGSPGPPSPWPMLLLPLLVAIRRVRTP